MWNVKESVELIIINEFIISHFKKLLTVEKMKLLNRCHHSFSEAVKICRTAADPVTKILSTEFLTQC